MRKLLTISKTIIWLIFILISIGGFSQKANIVLSDKELLTNHLKSDKKEEVVETSFLKPGSGGFLARYNPFRLLLGGMMFTYQRWISPQMPSECLFHTSCSHFSMELIYEFGLIKGSIATADRLMRCNRIAVFDIHPLQIHEVSGRAIEQTDIYRRKTK